MAPNGPPASGAKDSAQSDIEVLSQEFEELHPEAQDANGAGPTPPPTGEPKSPDANARNASPAPPPAATIDESESANGEKPTSRGGRSTLSRVLGLGTEHLKLYERIHALSDDGRTALCLSGGGIRSAAFNLGILQGLAQLGLLHRFSFLSTVSGGGYIGAWLSAWRKRAGGLEAVLAGLCWPDKGPKKPPKQLSNLRHDTSYLTPRAGLMSPDTWTALGLAMRNLLLNNLIVLPLIAAALLVPKLLLAGVAAHYFDRIEILLWAPAALLVLGWTATALRRPSWYPRHDRWKWAYLVAPRIGVGLVVAAAVIFALAGAGRFPQQSGAAAAGCAAVASAPSLATCSANAAARGQEPALMLRDGSDPADAPCIAATIAASARAAADAAHLAARAAERLVGSSASQADGVARSCPEAIGRTAWPILIAAAIGAAIALAAFILALIIVMVARPERSDDEKDAGVTMATAPRGARLLLAIAATVAGGVGGAFVGWGIWLAAALTQASSTAEALVLILGPLWLATGYFIADAIYLALAHRPRLCNGRKWNDRWGDEEREWEGRSNGYLSILTVSLSAFIAISLFGSLAWDDLVSSSWWGKIGAGFGLVTSGLASVGLGASPLTKSSGSSSKNKQIPTRLILVIATPIFAALLLIALSTGIDHWMLSAPLLDVLDHSKCTSPCVIDPAFDLTQPRGLIGALALAIALTLLSLIAARFVNINRFSLHDIYRQRLIREFLGATNLTGMPDPWTGFNTSDDLPLTELWPPSDQLTCLYPLFNATLNTVGSNHLQWQERKGASFVFTPMHCGAAAIGAFRPSGEYAKGVLVGSAMAISGAAAAPNAGYSTIPGLSLLMTLFNIRLGAWAGNPRRNRYRDRGPHYALKALAAEAFARTTDKTAYVYLSDGGHFDNLGLYEVLRRRCRYIVVSDAGCDPDYAFADLGNAARRAAIDLGIDINFDHFDLRKRGEKPISGAYAALGVIDYPEMAPGKDRHARGFLLYVKAGYHGDSEPPDVKAYALAHPDFPHQSTANQFFDEQQFESYRALGHYIIQNLAEKAGFAGDPSASLKTFFEACERYLRGVALAAAQSPRS